MYMQDLCSDSRCSEGSSQSSLVQAHIDLHVRVDRDPEIADRRMCIITMGVTKGAKGAQAPPWFWE